MEPPPAAYSDPFQGVPVKEGQPNMEVEVRFPWGKIAEKTHRHTTEGRTHRARKNQCKVNTRILLGHLICSKER